MAFTTQTEVELLLGETPADSQIADLSVANQAAFWTDVLEETDSTIYLYLAELYDAADLVGNKYLGQKAKYIAAYNFTKRRGNPAYYQDAYEEVIDELQRIRDGELKLPANDGSLVAQSSANMPGMANIIFDDRSIAAPIRVDSINSAGEQSSETFNYFDRFWGF